MHIPRIEETEYLKQFPEPVLQLIRNAVINACDMINDFKNDLNSGDEFQNPSIVTVGEQAVILLAVVLDPSNGDPNLVSADLACAVKEYAKRYVKFTLG